MGKLRLRTIRKMGFANAFERQVYETLRTEFSADKARVLFNCFFFWPNGEPSQTDTVMITRRGVFVIECKDYSGSVVGTDGDGDFNWKHTIIHEDGTKKEYKFLNPLYQNFMHIQCIKKNIDFAAVPVYSLVVFADKCDISKVRYSRPGTSVTSFSRMCGQIVLLSANSRCMLTNDEIEHVAEVIKSVAGDPKDNKENQDMLIEDRKARILARKNQLYVRYKYKHKSKKGLEYGKKYKVLKEDEDYYWLDGILGKSLKSRFEICEKEAEE